MKVTKQDGQKEGFDEGKLWDSLYYPARELDYDDQDAVDLADKAKHQIVDWVHNHEDNVITTKEIADKAKEVLRDIDDHVALMYDKHLDIN